MMPRTVHEIRDPIHTFVRMDDDERKVLNSRSFQRLRHIHQLGMTYLVYPGATHRRFEHSLGVMDLASRVFDVVTDPANVGDSIRDLLRPLANPHHRSYWRRVVRMAALCHDIGHPPFSHAAEKDLMPQGWDHERLTRKIISSRDMRGIWKSMTPPLRHKDIQKLAVGPKKARDLQFSDWEAILSEIITGDAFGVDRIDYLLRDSHHAGVAYGRFDHHRLIDTLRILPKNYEGEGKISEEPALGMEEGGIQSAEALMIARYLMYSQVYFHPVRRIYDIHLRDFLKEWLAGGLFPIKLGDYLPLVDDDIVAALWIAAFDKKKKGHEHARRIIRREHFKVIYELNPVDAGVNPEAADAIFSALKSNYHTSLFRYDYYRQSGGSTDFPVKLRDGRIVSSLSVSEALNNIPIVTIGRVFVDRAYFDGACRWLEDSRDGIIALQREGDDGQAG